MLRSQQAGGMIVAAVGSFIVTSLASVATGCATGLACAYFCKHTDITQHPHLELSILFLFAYGSYALNEALELSGIMVRVVAVGASLDRNSTAARRAAPQCGKSMGLSRLLAQGHHGTLCDTLGSGAASALVLGAVSSRLP